VPERTTGGASPLETLSELKDLVIAYVKQETVGPLRGVGRSIALGVGGSLVLSIGLVLLTLAVLRALQTETGSTFDGNWSWAPYVLTLLGVAVLIGLALAATRKRSTTATRGAR
jgi:hypothetical protein